MEPKERSPSFLGGQIPKTSDDDKQPSSSITKKMMFKIKPMPSIQLLQSLKMYSPVEQQASSTKKLNIKAVRTNELNLDEFKSSPKITSRNVRKQLWSVEKPDSKWTVEKGDKLRRVTVMKPGRDTLRKSVYSRPSTIKNNSKKPSKCLSIDDTLPLVDMEQFTVTKIKRTLFSAPQAKPSNQRKTTSNINVVNKLPVFSTFHRKTIQPKTPSIVITPVEKSAKKSNPIKNINTKPKIEDEKKSETMDLVFEKLTKIEDKISSFDDIKGLLCSICAHLGIEVPGSFLGKQSEESSIQQKPEEVFEQKPEQTMSDNCSNLKGKSPGFKKDGSLPTINENFIAKTEFKETVYKFSPFMLKQTCSVLNETSEEIRTGSSASTTELENTENDTSTESNSINFKVSSSSTKANSQLENFEPDITTIKPNIKSPSTSSTSKVSFDENLENIETKSIKNFEHLDTESIKNFEYLATESIKNIEQTNNQDDTNKKINIKPLNTKDISPSTSNPSKISLKPEDITTPKIVHKRENKTESTIKLKKTWITQFEQLENKLLNNSNESVNLQSSPDDSPILSLHLNSIVNDDDDVFDGLAVRKSPSTLNLLEPQPKNGILKARTDILTESICVYNELRDELPKFLSTPVSNTNRSLSFMTPSVQGNEKKLISRRVQEQLLRLNDC